MWSRRRAGLLADGSPNPEGLCVPTRVSTKTLRDEPTVTRVRPTLDLVREDYWTGRHRRPFDGQVRTSTLRDKVP